MLLAPAVSKVIVLLDIATIVLDAGKETGISRFPCARGSLHTFELACHDPEDVDCLVQIWSSQNYTWGMHPLIFRFITSQQFFHH